MKTLKLSALALVGAFFFVAQGASAQTATAKKAAAAPAAAATQEAPKNMTPSGITWKEDTHNFGDIEKGKPVSHEFTFKNTTKQTVLITNVKASCGCTATNYTKTPVKPGESATVTATFNAASPGSFTKNVTVTTNDSDVNKILTIKGKVLAPATEAAPAVAPSAN
ncbi:MAG: DUF1573 domain-containing protein [Flavobacterium psychrophilum]|nr:MAG: DUF1573 domain-containing protein [Flavobacterium psychrophilum]